MSFSKKTVFCLLIAGIVQLSLALPLVEDRKEVAKEPTIIVDEPSVDPPTPIKLDLKGSRDESCPRPGQKNEGPVGIPRIMESRIMEYAAAPAPAALPRAISEDSFLSKTLEEFVRSKRHADHLPETTTPTPSTTIHADTKEELYPGSGSSITKTPPMDSSEEDSRSRTNTSEVLGQLDLAREVDLCFLVDVTGSMAPYIAGVRDSINDIVDDLLNSSVTEYSVEDLRISFVGYRDFADGEDQFTMLPFTDNVTEFRDFVADTQATGGYNVPEDVFGGLDKALNLQWGEPSRTRLIFHIADAPGHGCELHLLFSDDFPGGDPEERTAEGLFGKMKEMKIQYFFGNITSDTDVMISKFSEVYGSEVKTFDIGVTGGGFYGGGYDGGLAGAPAARSMIYESVVHAVDAAVKKRVEGSR